jgi:type II secretory pathway component PulC
MKNIIFISYSISCIFIALSGWHFFCVAREAVASNDKFELSTIKSAQGIAILEPSFNVPDEATPSLLTMRDPFGPPLKARNETAVEAPKKMFTLKGLMLAVKPGIVLEEQPGGGTIFLSEGESESNILVKKVNADGAVLVVDGREVVLQSPSKVQ